MAKKITYLLLFAIVFSRVPIIMERSGIQDGIRRLERAAAAETGGDNGNGGSGSGNGGVDGGGGDRM